MPTRKAGPKADKMDGLKRDMVLVVIGRDKRTPIATRAIIP